MYDIAKFNKRKLNVSKILKQKKRTIITIPDTNNALEDTFSMNATMTLIDDQSQLFNNRQRKLLFYLELDTLQANFQNEAKMRQLLFSTKGMLKAFIYNTFFFHGLSKCSLTYHIHATSSKLFLYLCPTNLSSKQTIMWQSDNDEYSNYIGKTIFWLK